MILRSLIYAACLVFVCSASLAQNIPLRSGEHATFSRLVLSGAETASWSAEKSGDVLEVSFPDVPWTVSTDRVFDLIPRDRITDVSWSADETTLRISLACDCAYNIFRVSQSAIVIDISDPSTASGPIPTPQVAASVPPGPRRFNEVTANQIFSADTAPSTGNSTITQGEDGDLTAEAADFDEWNLESTLWQNINRSSSIGITPNNEPQPDIGNPSEPALQPLQNVEVRDTQGLPIPGLQSDEDVQACTDLDLINVTEWAGDFTPAELIAESRLTLSADQTTVGPAERRQAVRYLVAASLGAEAEQLLLENPDDGPDKDLLVALARIMENPTKPTKTEPLATYAGCEGQAALWVALAGLKETDAKAPIPESMLEEFDNLPPHLQTHLGPALARRMVESGREDLSNLILQLIATDTEEPIFVAPEKVTMAQIEEAFRDNSLTEIMDGIKTQSSDGMQFVVAALLRSLETGQPISKDLEDLGRSYLFTGADEKPYGALRNAMTMAFGANQNFEEAFEFLAQTQSNLTRKTRPGAERTRKFILEKLVSKSSDPKFLSLFLRHRDQLGEMDAATLETAARRLVDMGAFQEAINEIKNSAFVGQEKFSTILAEAYLGLSQPRQALSLLSGQTSEQALQLKAKAFSALELHAEAAKAFAELDQTSRAQSQLFLSQTEPSEADPALADLSETVSGRLAEISQLEADRKVATGTLSNAKELIDRSLQVRSSISSSLPD